MATQLLVVALPEEAFFRGYVLSRLREVWPPRCRLWGVPFGRAHVLSAALFAPRARKLYDAAICMYHDQALIPLKTLDVDGGVNVTLGLPFVRTSPDHGTAFDIAGTGKANPASLVAALQLATRLAAEDDKRRAANPAKPAFAG